MGMPTIDGLCAYGLLDKAGREQVLTLCLESACRYIQDSGVCPAALDDPQYELAVYMLALHYYDHRGVMDDTAAEIPHGLLSIIHHLRY